MMLFENKAISVWQLANQPKRRFLRPSADPWVTLGDLGCNWVKPGGRGYPPQKKSREIADSRVITLIGKTIAGDGIA